MNQGNNPLYGSGEKVAVAVWDGSKRTLANNASASCIDPVSGASKPLYLPDGALITKAYYHVATTFTDAGNDSSAIALGYTGATGAFVASVAISGSTNVWDAGAHGTLVGMGANLGADAAHDSALEVIALNAATMIHLTDNKEILLTTSDDTAISTGKLTLYVHYVQTGDFS